MSLPGKLCIGILEEDNPLKSYFRFKPLLVERDGSYAPYEDGARYGDEGCIRIVPDKNESYHFKSRMRRMGLYCVVDLRAHPDENDKIRPNKNYREGGPEINNCIIYSDVVREPAPDMIFEILRAQPDSLVPAPHTPSVLLKGEDVYPERYAWEAAADEEQRVRLTPTGETCAPDSVQVFDLAGFREERVSFAIVPASAMESVVAAPAPRPEPREAAHPAPPEKPALPEKPVPQEKPAPEERPAEEIRRVEAPEPKPEPPRPSAAPAKGAKEPEDKPWLDATPAPAEPAQDVRMSMRQRMLAAQTGLNPRRGRSLQELVDEKWQRSRLSQMGNAAADLATGAPVVSPVDSAVRAVREAWAQPRLRDELLAGLGGIEEFGASLQECREAVRQRDIELRLDALEERRLSMLRELDQLNKGGAELRKKLKDEIRRDEAASLADAVQKTEAAREEQRRYEALAEEARAAAQDARQAVDALTGEELERRLRDFALNQHMAERLELLRGEAEELPEEDESEALSLDALTERVVARFHAEGLPIERREALNLVACLGVSPNLILSGPVGSGKTQTARLLAEALGWEGERFAVVAPGTPVDEALFDLDECDGPAMALLDDANTARPGDAPWALTAGQPPERRTVLTVQDGPAGQPVPAYVLDRGFVVRLAPKADAPWRPGPGRPLPPVSPADLEASFEDLPAKLEALPAALEEGMDALRKGLAGVGTTVSRRALDESWRFCAILCEALGEDADPTDILDLAVSQRILPGLLASAPLRALAALPGILSRLPRSLALLDEPLPIEI